jgi:hypothetical protein
MNHETIPPLGSSRSDFIIAGYADYAIERRFAAPDRSD